jgi:L-cysteine desulfidase
MADAKPTRQQGDLAEMLDTLLDKGVVINADVAVTVGDTELLGVKLRAAVASFETAAEYGLAFPSGTDMDRVRDAAGVEELGEPAAPIAELGPSEATDDGSTEDGAADETAPAPSDEQG